MFGLLQSWGFIFSSRTQTVHAFHFVNNWRISQIVAFLLLYLLKRELNWSDCYENSVMFSGKKNLGKVRIYFRFYKILASSFDWNLFYLLLFKFLYFWNTDLGLQTSCYYLVIVASVLLYCCVYIVVFLPQFVS